MPMTNVFATALLALRFTNANLANVGDATGLRGSSTAGSDYVSLHTASPGPTGTQATNECAYGSYARQSAARSGAGFTASSRLTDNVAVLTFPEASSGSEVARFWGLGFGASGATDLHWYGHIGGLVKPVVCIDTSGDLLTCETHGFVATDEVVFWSTPGQTLPTGITAGTVYYVIAGGLTTNVFAVSATLGGSSIAITGVGAGHVGKVTPLTITSSPPVTPRIPIGNLQIRI